MDIQLVLDMSDYEIDDLHYFTKEVDTSSIRMKEETEDTKPKVTILRRDLAKGLKRLIKVFVIF